MSSKYVARGVFKTPFLIQANFNGQIEVIFPNNVVHVPF